MKHGLERMVFTSSEGTVYGASQGVYGDRPVTEADFCSPADHVFTYGVMKVLNEFMAQKYVRKHGISIVCTRPPVVFGHGRKRGSLLWAETFVSLPAIGEPVSLPFPAATRDCWVYVDDCAEQLVRLALKPKLATLLTIPVATQFRLLNSQIWFAIGYRKLRSVSMKVSPQPRLSIS